MIPQLCKILHLAVELCPRDDAERAVQGFIFGAAYALKKALELGPVDEYPPSDHERDYVGSATAVLNDTEHEHAEYLFGYYCNDALLRCGALFGRVGTATGEQLLSPQTRRTLQEFQIRLNTAPTAPITPKELLEFLDCNVAFLLKKRRQPPAEL